MLPACCVVSAKTLKAVTPTEGHQNNAECDGWRGRGSAVWNSCKRGCVYCTALPKNQQLHLVFTLKNPLMPSSLQTVLFISPAAKNISRLLKGIKNKCWKQGIYVAKCLWIPAHSTTTCDDDFFTDLALCKRASLCWNRNVPLPNRCHKAGSTLLSKKSL